MDTQLKLFNSLTRSKDPFRPIRNKLVTWYSCGPTVYDSSHLGHARCYITFDIIRRILSSYFGYQVIYCMNITDIDDKIIKKARCAHLYEQYVQMYLQGEINHHDLVAEIDAAIESYKTKRAQETDTAKQTMMDTILDSATKAYEKIANRASLENRSDLRETIEQTKDILAEYRDSKLAHTVSDHGIFKNLTLKNEQDFLEDMTSIDVMPPNVLTRVSEYIDEIGAYIKKLEENGFAYRAGGSVYFDTAKFDADPKHTYAKLMREAYGEKKSLDDGEGELSASDSKRSPNDFALWKKSKPGEPNWTTADFEPGRPGWHIECSVMASDIFGRQFDIHSGGHDLKFPHHDNEIAQAEAYYNTGDNWVNCFIHSGHLTISGCKMSKSLKNFITIKQALKDYSSRQLRFAFLSHGWAETLDYSTNTMNTALSYEKTFKEFFLNLSDTIRRRSMKSDSTNGMSIGELFKKWTDDDHQLNDEYMNVVNNVHAALCNNLDTRSALNLLSGLVKECNKKPNSDTILLRDISAYIQYMLAVFGVNFNEVKWYDKGILSNAGPSLSLISSSTIPGGQPTSASGDGGIDNSENGLKFVEAIAKFRAEIRHISKSVDPQQCVKQILSLCDTLRDTILPDLGVRLEDKEGANGCPYVVKLLDADTIAREKALAERRDREKKLKEEEKLKAMQQLQDKRKMPPSEMFRKQTDKYSQFDDKGIPTHDVSGKELGKSALKKLQRLYADQVEKHEKYLQSLSDQSTS